MIPDIFNIQDFKFYYLGGMSHTRVGKTRSVSSLNNSGGFGGGGPHSSSPGGSKEPSISSRKTSKTSLDNMEEGGVRFQALL